MCGFKVFLLVGFGGLSHQGLSLFVFLHRIVFMFFSMFAFQFLQSPENVFDFTVWLNSKGRATVKDLSITIEKLR